MIEADENDWEEDDEPERQGVNVPSASFIVRSAFTYRYVARLFCGHVVGGWIQAPEILEMGTHGAWCDEHEHFALFEDLVSTKPLRDKWGRP